MQAIMEPIFEIPYLIGVVLLGILTIRQSDGRAQFKLFGIMAVLLGCGDAFHLVPRMWALFEAGSTGELKFAAMLGIGKLVTSITMTLFYVMLYHVWRSRYEIRERSGLTICIYILAIARIVLCFMPQNQWTSLDAPLRFGIYRNIPFAIMGAIIIVIYFLEAKRKNDRAFRFMWLAVTLSFAFYIPVVLLADAIPLLGMLMIPKTCAYVWVIAMGYMDSKNGKVLKKY